MYKKDFNLLILGQIISIITGSALSFTLGLYILKTSGSSQLFGIITAASAIPWLFFGPLGGVLADKYNQRNIMVFLDLITGLALIYSFSSGINIGTACFLKLLFSSVQATYFPSVVSSLPLIVDKKDLAKANSVVTQVDSMARIISPMAAGVLYSIINVNTIVLICGGLFIFSALIEVFIKIDKSKLPVIHHENSLKTAFKFITSQSIFWIVLASSLVISVAGGITVVGFPFIINIFLKLSSTEYGILSGILGLGSFVAGFIVYRYHNKLKITKLTKIYSLVILMIFLLGLSLFIKNIALVFPLICILGFILNLALTVGYIVRNTYIQRICPQHLLGKTMSIVTIIAGLFEPTMQIIYGSLFEQILPSWILSFSSIALIPCLFIIKVMLSKVKKEHI